MINIGMRARDRVTGYTGLVVARTVHLEDATAVCLEGKVERGERSLLWFNETRVELFGAETESPLTRQPVEGPPRVDVPPIEVAESYPDPFEGKLREVLLRTLHELGFDIVPIKRGERRPFAR